MGCEFLGTQKECDVRNVWKQCSWVGPVQLGNIQKLVFVRFPNQ